MRCPKNSSLNIPHTTVASVFAPFVHGHASGAFGQAAIGAGGKKSFPKELGKVGMRVAVLLDRHNNSTVPWESAKRITALVDESDLFTS